MTDLERRKKAFELSRVRLAREEMELKIAEREDEINKLKDAITKQINRENEILEEMK